MRRLEIAFIPHLTCQRMARWWCPDSEYPTELHNKLFLWPRAQWHDIWPTPSSGYCYLSRGCAKIHLHFNNSAKYSSLEFNFTESFSLKEFHHSILWFAIQHLVVWLASRFDSMGPRSEVSRQQRSWLRSSTVLQGYLSAKPGTVAHDAVLIEEVICDDKFIIGPSRTVTWSFRLTQWLRRLLKIAGLCTYLVH